MKIVGVSRGAARIWPQGGHNNWTFHI